MSFLASSISIVTNEPLKLINDMHVVGAGTAKPCFTAALFHPFKECRGIELLGDLCDLAQQIAERYHTVGFESRSLFMPYEVSSPLPSLTISTLRHPAFVSIYLPL